MTTVPPPRAGEAGYSFSGLQAAAIATLRRDVAWCLNEQLSDEQIFQAVCDELQAHEDREAKRDHS